MRAIAALLPLALALAGCQSEQQPKAGAHSGHSSTAPAPNEAARALDTAMDRMHRDMGKASADADESFMRMMIAHHRGAIDMARIELQYGKDPEARRLAEQVIAAQTAEISQIEVWLGKRAAPAGKTR